MFFSCYSISSRDADIHLGCYFRARILFLKAEESVPEEIERGFSFYDIKPLPVFDDDHHEVVFNLVQGHPVLLNNILANALLLGRKKQNVLEPRWEKTIEQSWAH